MIPLKRFSINRKFFKVSAIPGIIAGFFILYPVGVLILKSLMPGAGSSHSGAFTDFFTGSALNALGNSFILAVMVTSMATFAGGSLAWLVTRTDIPGKKFMEFCTVLAFISPPYIMGLAWLTIWGRNGYIERTLSFLGFAGGHGFQYYSLGAAAFILSIHLFPIIYMAIKNSLCQIDPDLEKAALTCGASKTKSAFKITVPLVIPAILASALFAFSRAMANFEVPALLCLPLGTEVMTTRIFASLSDLDIASASKVSFILVLISSMLFLLQTRFLIKNHGVAKTIGVKKNVKYSLGRKKWPIFIIYTLFLSLISLAPLAMMFISSFLKRWGLPLEWKYFTLNNYFQLIFKSSNAHSAFLNSLTYGFLAASGAAIICCSIVFLSRGGNKKSAALLEALASWPMAFPNIVLALGAILAYNSPPFALYGTMWAIVVTYMVIFTPIMLKQITGLIENHDPSLLSAARISGASAVKSFFAVTLPAIVPGIQAGFVIAFVIALREIPVSLLLHSSGQETVGVLLFGIQSQSHGLEMTSALAMIIIVLIFAGNRLTNSLGKRKRS